MPPGFELTPELLVTQGRALRRLARSMLGDEHAAEDVVQETWVACLRHPDALPERVSAWLGTITRRMALRRVRGEARRGTREHHVAAHERVEAAQQRSLEHEEALRAVTQALAALEEPFKTALILRYHEERTPAEIARELDVPLATVKSRLARGLEKLRAALGRELGQERRGQALAVLAGVRLTTAGGSSLTLGGLALGAKTKVAAAVVILGGLLFVLTRDGERAGHVAQGANEKVALAPVAEQPEAASGLTGSADGTREAAPVREAAPAEAAPPAPLAFPSEASYTQRLVGRVLDSNELPVLEARVLLSPAGLDFNLAATTDAEGHFAVEFATRQSALGCAWKVEVGGQSIGPGWLEFQAGGTSELDLTLGSEVQQAMLFRVALGGELVLDAQDIRGVGSSLRLLGQPEGAPEMVVGPDGRRHFVEHWAPGSCPGANEEPQEEVVLDYGEEATLEFSVTNYFVSRELSVTGGMPLEAPGLARVQGIVRDASGAPVAGASVGYGAPGQTLAVQVPTDEQGAFVLEGVPPGEWRLRARGPAGQGSFEERLTITGDAPVAWNPLLERGRELTGRLLLPEDKPAAGVEVELVQRERTRFARKVQRTNEDGRFAFQGLDEGAYELFLRSADGALPVRVAGPFHAPMEVGTLRLEPAELVGHAARVRPLGPEGEDLPGAVLRLWQEASGLALERRGLDEEGWLACNELPAGFYRVELGSLHGWRALGTHWLGEEDLDLGPVAFPRASLLWLEPDPAPTDEPRPAASLWRAHPEVLTRLEENWTGRLARAALPGDYVLCLAEGAEARALPLELGSGRTTALELDGLLAPRPLRPPAAGARAACLACHVDPQH